MIITKTPLRISFAGGGTDLPDFYNKYSGAVLNTAINFFIYVTVKRHGILFNENYRLNYSEVENVHRLDDIKNDIARECLRLLPVEPPIYISTVGDLPTFSGLGSSSSFAVGLINALHALRGERVGVARLAEEAAHVEIDILKRPIGKQDHYVAAFGGLNYIQFLPDCRVSIESHNLTSADLDKLFECIMLFWTGITRDSSSILVKQKKNIPQCIDNLIILRDQATELHTLLKSHFDPYVLGRELNINWENKRKLANGISNEKIDAWYKQAIDAGAIGGKLCGAGGGGFLLFIVLPDQQDNVRCALNNLHDIDIKYEPHGSRILISSFK